MLQARIYCESFFWPFVTDRVQESFSGAAMRFDSIWRNPSSKWCSVPTRATESVCVS